MRIVIADDSLLLAEGLELILTEANHEVVARASDGPAAIEAVLAHRPDIAILDVRMPPSHTDEGMRAAVSIRKHWPTAPLMILSQYVTSSYASELLGPGFGYLLKDRVSQIDHFLDSLEQVAAGGTVIDQQVIKQLLTRPARNPVDDLTPREGEVLALMAQGLSNSAIARELVVTSGAVEKHTQRIFGKLDLAQDADQHRRVRAVLAWLDQR